MFNTGAYKNAHLSPLFYSLQTPTLYKQLALDNQTDIDNSMIYYIDLHHVTYGDVNTGPASS